MSDEYDFEYEGADFKIPKEMLENALKKMMAHHITVDFMVFLNRIKMKAAIGPTEQDVDDFVERVLE
jgi:hypothetical protein